MHGMEPHQTALLLLVVGLLFAASGVFSRVSRFGIPVVLIFLGIGMLAGSEGIGGIAFEDYGLSFRVGMIALVLILFDGGLNTTRAQIRSVGLPAGVLATLGVLASAGLVAMTARAVGFGWAESFLLGAIVSSTDAAAVFSVLRSSGLQLRPRVGDTIEVESGLNDPMAVVLTLALTEVALGGSRPDGGLVVEVVVQLALGVALGWIIGRVGSWVLLRLGPASSGLYPVFVMALAFLAFGATTLVSGSGFLATYVAGMTLSDRPMPYRGSVLRVFDGLGWLSQVVMFLVLGLLVFPSRVWSVAVPGLLVALALAFVIRPAVVLLCLLPFRYTMRERLFVGWVGLRGAVPIILGVYPVLAGVPGAVSMFNVVFFVVLASVILQGGSVRWVMRALRLGRPIEHAPPALLELSSRIPLRGEVLSFHVRSEFAIAGEAIRDIPFPPESGIVMLIRDDRILAPHDAEVLRAGDHVYVTVSAADRPFVQLLFGRAED